MPSFPQLIEEDLQQINAALQDLLGKSEATIALIVEKAGYLITECGDRQVDTRQLATLAANAFNATQFIAGMVNESNFSSMYQQGEHVSLLLLNVDENCLLVVIFKASMSVGAIKYYAISTVKTVANQLQIAHQRSPGVGYDLADLNLPDAAELFRKKKP